MTFRQLFNRAMESNEFFTDVAMGWVRGCLEKPDLEQAKVLCETSDPESPLHEILIGWIENYLELARCSDILLCCLEEERKNNKPTKKRRK